MTYAICPRCGEPTIAVDVRVITGGEWDERLVEVDDVEQECADTCGALPPDEGDRAVDARLATWDEAEDVADWYETLADLAFHANR